LFMPLSVDLALASFCFLHLFQWCLIMPNILQSNCTTEVIFRKRYSELYLYPLQFETTQWSRIVVEKMTDFHFIKKYPDFFGSRKLITIFTTASHRSLSWIRWIQSTHQCLISFRLVLILWRKWPFVRQRLGKHRLKAGIAAEAEAHLLGNGSLVSATTDPVYSH
jgi:hypothetical protein